MNGQKKDFDVAIIGAGPAGTAAAIRCCQAGLRVLIIEREAFPRYRPGESLHPGAEPILRSLGVMSEITALAHIRYSGHWFFNRNSCNFIPFGGDNGGRWLGFQVWRADLDRVLLNKAIEAGCTVWQPCRAHRPLLEHNKVVGVATEKGAVSTRFLIDASGACHWLARHLDLRFAHTSPRLIVEYGYQTTSQQSSSLDDPILWVGSRSWRWEARVKDNLYHWCRLMPSSPSFDESSSIKGPAFAQAASARRADMTWRLVPAAAGAGYFIVGDAAVVMDPSSSHGVLRAMMSGMCAAQSVTALGECGNARDVAFAYRKWLTSWFQADTSALYQTYSRLVEHSPQGQPDHADRESRSRVIVV
jgi:flavin-dependent dehydrogenase